LLYSLSGGLEAPFYFYFFIFYLVLILGFLLHRVLFGLKLGVGPLLLLGNGLRLLGSGLLSRSLRGLSLLGYGLGSFGLGWLSVDKLLCVSDVAPAKVTTLELLGARGPARNALDVGSGTRVFLGCALGSLGFVTGTLVIVRAFALNVTPNAVHEFLLVTTNLEAVVLAELVQHTGGAIAKVVECLTARRVLDLVSLENFLGLLVGGVCSGDCLAEDVFEEVFHAPGHENTDVVFQFGVDVVLRDEGVDAGLDAGHFEVFFRL